MGPRAASGGMPGATPATPRCIAVTPAQPGNYSNASRPVSGAKQRPSSGTDSFSQSSDIETPETPHRKLPQTQMQSGQAGQMQTLALQTHVQDDETASNVSNSSARRRGQAHTPKGGHVQLRDARRRLDSTDHSKDDDNTSNASSVRRGSKPLSGKTRQRASTHDLGVVSVKSGAGTRSTEAAPLRRKKQEDRGPNQDAEIWWRKVQTGVLLHQLTRNVPTLDWLATKSPEMFDASQSEAQAPGVAPGAEMKSPCEVCGEKASASGWGNPGCVACSGVDAHCSVGTGVAMNISQHIFGVLLQSHYPGCPSGEMSGSKQSDEQSDALTAEDFDDERERIVRQVSSDNLSAEDKPKPVMPSRKTVVNVGNSRKTIIKADPKGDDEEH